MDLNRVAAFARVVHHGSFTAAAKALGVPKSSVSRSVAQLETDLGARLLHRTTRKLHLTDAGSELYQRIAPALADLEEATAAASDTQSEPRGVVRVTAPHDIGVWLLAGSLARFTRAHAGIQVEVSLSARVEDMVAEGLDLAVRAGPVRDGSLVARKAGRVDLGLYASRRWVSSHAVPSSPAGLAEVACVLFRPRHGRCSWTLHSTTGARETVEVTGAIGTDDLSFVKRAVLAHGGVGLVPSFLCAREERSEKLVRILPSWSHGGGELSVVYPSARFLPRRVALVRDHLIAELGAALRGD